MAGTDHTLVVTDWKGAPSNPYSYADITEKFLRYADGVLTPDRANEVVRRVAHLEDEGDMAELARLIAGQQGFPGGSHPRPSRSSATGGCRC